MRNKNPKFLMKCLCLMTLLTMHLLGNAEVLYGQVIGVTDGDTINVIDSSKQQHKIRLMGIDAPEKSQAFGRKSKQSLSELVYKKHVEVTWHKKDRYQRLIGKVQVDGIDVCLEQIKRGLAWHYKQYEREQTDTDRKRYASAEEEARAAKFGLWSENKQQMPSDYRKENKK